MSGGEGQQEKLYTKQGVAIQQLEAAALLLLKGGFDAATHTLLGAVQQLLEDHAVANDNRVLLAFKASRDQLASAMGIEVKELLNIERRPRNFFKHADKGIEKDPHAILLGVDLEKQNALIFVLSFVALVSKIDLTSVLLPAFVFCADQCEDMPDFGAVFPSLDYYTELQTKLRETPVGSRRELMLREYERLKVLSE